MMEILKRIVAEISRVFLSELRVEASPLFGVKLSIVRPEVSKSIDDRLANIESARQSLQEALTAVDDLRVQAEKNKREFVELSEKLDRAQDEKQLVSTEIANLRTLSNLDTKLVRKALAIPSPLQVWLERVISFCLGVGASLAASAIWDHLR